MSQSGLIKLNKYGQERRERLLKMAKLPQQKRSAEEAYAELRWFEKLAAQDESVEGVDGDDTE